MRLNDHTRDTGPRSYGRIALVYVSACLSVLQLSRLAYALNARERLITFSASEFISSWLLGLKFDLAATAMFIGLPLLMLALPTPARIDRAWRSFWLAMASMAVMVLTLACIADYFYADEVRRHIGQEIMTVAHDLDFLLAYALGPAKPGLLLMALLAVAAYFQWKMQTRIGTKRPSLIVAIAALLLTTLAIRGSVTSKPLNPIDAFASSSYELAQVSLNGPFSMVKSISRTTPSINADTLSQARATLGLDDHSNPFSRHAGKRTPHNVIVVLLESWSASYVDTFNNGRHLGVAPEMDALASDGLVFSNFYAAGQRSYEGIQAVMTGLPALPGIPSLSEGLTIRTTQVGSLAAQQGVRTLFMQASERRSLRLDAVAKSLGFAEYYGREDVPRVLLDYPDADAFRFGLDYESLQNMVDHLHGEQKQFLAFLFTGSTHTPVAAVPANLRAPVSPDNPDREFLDAIHYSDWSIGQFIKRARQEPWFDNTVFIFTADHTRGSDEQLRDRFHTPMVIYAPAIFSHRVDTRIGAQVDVFDTAIDLLGIEGNYFSAGHSLMAEPATSMALFRSGENLGLMTPDETLMYEPSMESSTHPAARYLQASRVLLYSTISRDRWTQ